MHLCIYVYILHACVMKENGKPAIQRDRARLRSGPTRALWNSVKTNAKSCIWEGRNAGSNTGSGCLAGMHLIREQHEPAATPGPAWWPMWHSPTGLVTRFIDSSRHTKGWIVAQHSQGSSQEQKELEAGTGLDTGTAAVWLTARDSAEMGSWAGALGGGPRVGWAGQLSSWCAQGADTPVLTRPGYAGGDKVDMGQLCALSAKAVWVEQCPVERVIPPCSVLIQPHLDTAYTFGPLIQGRSCKTRIHWRPSSWPGLEYLPCEGGWGYWACASCILRKRQL